MDFQKYARPVSHQSRFGGLWTDLTNADEIATGKLQLGQITAEEEAMLRSWIQNGYIIIENAVPAELIDEALDDVARIYKEGKALVETYEFNDVRLVGVEERHRQMPHKLIDAYALSEPLRKMQHADRISRFLNLVFDRPALAFQSLYFEWGSQQSIHQDTAYVRINRPMEMAASWIAMEDIQEGSGELEYFVGSHRIPEFLFQGTDKWMPYDASGAAEHPAFLAHIQEESAKMGLKKERFRPRKGDALIWSADLCHGGSPVTNKVTRRSFVTHYCPSTANPFYVDASGAYSGKIQLSNRGYYSYSFHGNAVDPYKR